MMYWISGKCHVSVADPQSLLEEKESLEKKLAISEYDLRLAQEDLLRLKSKLQKQTEFPDDKPNGKMEFAHLV